jgi:polyvinyl alcohol dehydrogenase (cytochrome)
LVYSTTLSQDAAASSPVLFFGDGFANVYAIDAATGSMLWKVKIDNHPAARIVGTPVLFKDRLYVPVGSWGEEQAAASPDYSCCTFRGSLVALDRATGNAVWKRYTIPSPAIRHAENDSTKPQLGPSGASIWSTPTLDEKRNLIYFGTGDNFSDPPDDNSDAIFAIDATTGEVRWKRQVTANDAYNDGCDGGMHLPTCPAQPGPDIDFTAPPILLKGTDGREILVAGQKSGDVYAFNPDTGLIIWHTRISHESNPWSGGVWFGMAVQHGRLFVPAASMLVPTAPAPPVKSFQDVFLGSPVNGLYALDVSDGHLLWSTPAGEHCEKPVCASVMMAPVAIPGAILAGSPDGYIHAFDERTGRSLWSFNTAQEFKSTNGEVARGGMIMGAGAIMVASGTLYVTSSSLKDSSVLLALSTRSID